MLWTTMAIRDLVEIFGFAPDDKSSYARRFWQLGGCPFIKSGCTKTNHDKSIVYGTCSVTSPYGDTIICPNRLYAEDYMSLRAIARDAFGKTPLVLYDEFLSMGNTRKSFVVALGQRSGKEVSVGRKLSMDWVLALVKGNKLVDYAGVEVQSIDITGNYRDAWHYYNDQSLFRNKKPSSGHGLNWANVHKRLIPQIIRKGRVYSKSDVATKGLYFVLPEIVFNKFEEILGDDFPEVLETDSGVLTVMTYSLGPKVKKSCHRSLVKNRQMRISLDVFAQRFIDGPNLPSGEELDQAVRNVLGLR